MTKKILLSGTLAFDRIMNFPGHFKNEIMPDKLHILNVSFLVEELKESFGGTAANIAYTLSLFGLQPMLTLSAGQKDYSKYKRWLKQNQIDTGNIKVYQSEYCSAAYIITDQDDNQITAFHPGALKYPRSTKKFSTKDVSLAVVSAQLPKDMAEFPKIFKNKKIPYIYDPGQQLVSLSSEQLVVGVEGSEVVVGNDYEISLLLKKTKWDLPKLIEKTKALIITLGSQGSMVYAKGRRVKITAAKARKVVDPTGAGDAYRAGLIYGMENGKDLETSAKAASLAAVYAVEKQGTQNHYFNLTQFKRRYRQTYNSTL